MEKIKTTTKWIGIFIAISLIIGLIGLTIQNQISHIEGLTLAGIIYLIVKQ